MQAHFMCHTCIDKGYLAKSMYGGATQRTATLSPVGKKRRRAFSSRFPQVLDV